MFSGLSSGFEPPQMTAKVADMFGALKGNQTFLLFYQVDNFKWKISSGGWLCTGANVGNWVILKKLAAIGTFQHLVKLDIHYD